MVISVSTWFCWFVLGVVTSFVYVSLFLDPPYLGGSRLVSELFFGSKLKNGLSHVWNRREKVAKGGKRWELTLPVSKTTWLHADFVFVGILKLTGQYG